MDLLLMRHAEASGISGGSGDIERPLTRRGREDAEKIAHVLIENELVPSLILMSPALRIRETVDQILPRLGSVPTRVLEELYLAEPSTILGVIADHGEGQSPILIVGHNPGMEVVVSQLSSTLVPFSTGALAHVRRVPNEIAEVVAVWRPQELPVL